MADLVLDVRDLTVVFQGDRDTVTAVDGISFRLQRGRTLGLVGESGSGKSVTALAIMGLVADNGTVAGRLQFFEAGSGAGSGDRPDVQPNSGTGQDLLTLTEGQRQGYRGRRIAMVFQEPMSALNPVYTCGFQLLEALRQHRSVTATEALKMAAALLQEVQLLPSDGELVARSRRELGLAPEESETEDRPVRDAIARRVNQQKRELLDRYPHQLSGGQLQRLTIAMALAGDPAILIADEPTTALDVTVQASILKLLKELRDRRGMAMLFVTHDLGVVADIADEVAVMNRGRIVEAGPVAAIFSQPQDPYTQGLLACRPNPHRTAARLLTVADFVAQRSRSDGAGGSDLAAQADLVPVPPLEPAADGPEQAGSEQASAAGRSPLLSVRQLRVTYPVRGAWGQTQRYVMAVNGVSFDLFPGETLGLVGESGCGKSTLSRAILRLVNASQGRVYFDGQDVFALRGAALRRLRQDLQIVFQDPFGSLDPRLRVGAAIAEPLTIHRPDWSAKRRRDRVAELLERVGLDGASGDRYPHEFSGGQRQRICIARALALSPRCIICDESVSALDVSVQAQVLNLLKDLQAELGLAYLFISHDLSVVKFMSDRIAVMKDGRFEELGTANQIYFQPQRPYTQTLIAAVPTVDLDRLRQGQHRGDRAS
ncbi:MAG: dipeptide ABC transporter ATP-binding protein [Cyanophyceae cyanobacterium]